MTVVHHETGHITDHQHGEQDPDSDAGRHDGGDQQRQQRAEAVEPSLGQADQQCSGSNCSEN